jgi:hypothetical protein
MRNLMIAFLMMIGFTSVEAQISFEGNKMITIHDDKRRVENIDSRIIINADTTEIQVHLKAAKIKEPIGELYSTFGDEGYKILVYKLKNDELLILHFNEDVLFSVVFQTGMTNKLEFEI